MEKQELQVGQVVQLNPETARNLAFAGCFMIVTEPRLWGAHGYVQDLGTREKAGGQAYYRAEWEEMTDPIGFAQYVAG